MNSSKSASDGQAPAHTKATPAEKSMKREARTAAENGDPVGADDGSSNEAERKPPPTKGDAAVGESDNEGSSPYGLPGRPEKPLREK